MQRRTATGAEQSPGVRIRDAPANNKRLADELKAMADIASCVPNQQRSTAAVVCPLTPLP